MPDILIIATGMFALAYLVARVLTRIIWPEMRSKLPPYEVYGDIANLPEGLRRTTPRGGGTGAVARSQDRTGCSDHLGTGL